MVYVPSATLVKFRTKFPFPPQVAGLVIDPTEIAGLSGWALITALPEAGEVQPSVLVTVKVRVPVVTPLKVIAVPAPEPVIVPPVETVTVQFPDAGSPLKATLPVAVPQVGWVMAPTIGAVGACGCALMTTLADAVEVHPAALVTVKLCVPVAMPERVVLAPVPVILPGLIVHVPEAGSPLKATLPVAVPQVGWVMAPTVGADGAAGSLSVALTPAGEVQPLTVICKSL